MTLRIALISDIHRGPEGLYFGQLRKLSRFSAELTQHFVDQVNNQLQPELVFQLGDLIEETDHQQDLTHFKEVLGYFSQISVPVHHVVGNHDQVHLSLDELRQLLQLEQLYYSFDYGNFHFVVLFGKSPVPGDWHGSIAAEQLEWLKADLENANKPTVVLVHHCLAGQPVPTNPFFAPEPNGAYITNRDEVCTVLSSSQKVVCVLNGHIHRNYMMYKMGIPFLTVQSLVENFSNDDRTPAAAYALLELGDTSGTLSIFGNDPATFKFQFPKLISHPF